MNRSPILSKLFSSAALVASLLSSGFFTSAHADGLWGDSDGVLDRLSAFVYGQPAELDPTFATGLNDLMTEPGMDPSFAPGKVNELKPRKKVKGKRVGTLKFKHFYKGLEVLGSEAFVHFGHGKKAKKQIRQIRKMLAKFDLDVKPTVTEQEAVSLARGYGRGQRVSVKPQLKILPNKKHGSAQLIYVVQVDGVASGLDDESVDVMLNAHTGAHLATLPRHLNVSTAPVSVLSARDQGIQVTRIYNDDHLLTGCGILSFSDGSKSTLDASTCRALVKSSCQALAENGRPLSLNPASCPASALVSTDESALRATSNAHAMLDYYQDVHQRNSYDDKGAPLVSIVHAGGALANASWYLKGQFIAYGEGDGVTTGDFTRALDVAAHEFTHAITDNDVHMVSIGETGALNEAYSDFFGKMIENTGSWVMGEKLALKPGTPGVRDLARPENLVGDYFDAAGDVRHVPYPSRTADMAPIVSPCTDRNDYCGIHYNTTVPGHASQQIFQALGQAKAQQLYYLTLTQFLTETSDFQGAANATLLACEKILDTSDCARVRTVFSDAGML